MVGFVHFSIFLFRQRNITIYSLVGSPCIHDHHNSQDNEVRLVYLWVDFRVILTYLILQLTHRTIKSVHRSLAQISWLYSMWVERSSGLKLKISESFQGVENIFEIFVIVFCSKVTSGKDCVCLFDGRDLEILWWFCRGGYTSGSQTALSYLLQRLKWCTFCFWMIL